MLILRFLVGSKGEDSDKKVGWVERSETQHQPSYLLGFVA